MDILARNKSLASSRVKSVSPSTTKPTSQQSGIKKLSFNKGIRSAVGLPRLPNINSGLKDGKQPTERYQIMQNDSVNNSFRSGTSD